MDADGTPVRMTVAQAAQALNISAEAVRQRVRRGTLPTEKSADGSVFVLIAPERTRTDTDGTEDGTPDKGLLAAHLDHAVEEIRFLRAELSTRNEELRRKDHIIAALTERIPALEAPSDGLGHADTPPASRESAETPREEPADDTGHSRRSWWRRLFLGE